MCSGLGKWWYCHVYLLCVTCVSTMHVVMSTAWLRAVEPLSQAVILASQADKSAPSSEPLRPARAMPKGALGLQKQHGVGFFS